MSDRSVVVRLRAEINSFKSGMDQAARAALQVGEAAARGNQKAARELAVQQKNAKSSAQAWDQVRNASTIAGAGMVAGFALVTRASMNFEQQISNVKAATHATAAEMDQLKQAALDAGARTQYSASEAAQGIESLAKAGQTTADIIGGGLDGALALAAAGSIDVGQAAEIAATTMTQFNLKGSDMAHVADLLAAGSGKAQGDVQDLALALGYVGTTASQMGVSVEETTGALAMLAANGQLGEKAGTGLRGVLSSLTSPSQQATKVMDKYGISLYDTQGKFVGLAGMAEQLQAALGPLDEKTRNAALGQIFGNAQIETARILYKGGAQAVSDWTKKVDDQGYAAETAATKMDNLSGDLETLGGAFETLMISSGEGSGGGLRWFVQTATSLLDVLADLPGPLQTTIVGVMGLGGAALILAPRVLAVKSVLAGLRASRVLSAGATTADTAAVTANTTALNANSAAAARNGAAVGKAGAASGVSGAASTAGTAGTLGALTAGMGSFAGAATLAAGAVTSLGSAFMTSEVTKQSGDLAGVLVALTGGMAGGPLNILAIKMAHDAKAAEEFAPKLEALKKVMSEIAVSGDPQKAASAFQAMKEEIGDDAFDEFINTAAPEVQQAFHSIEDAAKNVDAALAKAQDGFAFGSVHALEYARELVNTGRAAGKTDDQIRELLHTAGAKAGQIKIAMSADPTKIQQDIGTAQAALNSLKQYRRPDIVAEVGRLQGQLTNSQRALNSLRQAKKPDIDAINRVADRVKTIRGQIDGVKQRGKPSIDVNKQPALTGIGIVVGALAGITDKQVTITTKHVNVGAQLASGGPVAGPVIGPGTSTSDSVPAMLSNGEYVIKAAAVKKYGPRFFDKANAMKLAGGGVVRYRNPNQYKKALAAWQERRQSAVEAGQASSQRIAQTKEGFRGQALMSFDFSAYPQAQQAATAAIKDEADALKNLQEARKNALKARGADRPAALREAAAAQRRYAESVQATADAQKAEAESKPTAANIIQSFTAKVQQMQQFAGNLGTLRAWGVPSLLISDILGSGLESGPQMAAALVGAGKDALSPLAGLNFAANLAGNQLAALDVAVSSPDPGGLSFNQIAAQKNAAIRRRPVLVKKRRAMGGPVYGPGTGTSDDVPIWASNGEYVIKKKAVDYYGLGTLHGINSMRFAQGGLVNASLHAVNTTAGAPVAASQPLQLVLDSQVVWDGVIDYHARTGFTARGAKVLK